MIKVLFFAELRERLGESEVLIKDFIGTTVTDVLRELEQLNPRWHAILSEQKILIAVNHTMSGLSAPVKRGDEIAFFPPVTGG
jgi:molybdopterin synthase sulfur carrier subunit